MQVALGLYSLGPPGTLWDPLKRSQRVPEEDLKLEFRILLTPPESYHGMILDCDIYLLQFFFLKESCVSGYFQNVPLQAV